MSQCPDEEDIRADVTIKKYVQVPRSYLIAFQSTLEIKIYICLTCEEGEDERYTFNRRFNAVFGNDYKDVAGRVSPAPNGMGGTGRPFPSPICSSPIGTERGA